MNLLSDEYFMSLAFKQAEKAFNEDEVPIGAVIVLEKKIIGKAHNQVEILRDATAHAEILAITQANQALNNWRLNNAILYVTKEPCAMCAGAIVNSRIKKVVFASSDNNFGGCGGHFSIHNAQKSIHKVQVVKGLMEKECTALIQHFFKKKRLKTKK